jgi:ubiquinol-cytochrome c reductase cytochrome c subunit
MRRRTVLVATLAVLAAAPAAGAQAPVTRPTDVAGRDQVKRGAELFAANCSTCHGSRGQGVAPGRGARGANGVDGAGPSLLGVGAQAADFYLTTGYMPLGRPDVQPVRRRPSFDRTEVRALTAYVASLGRGPAVPSDTVDGSVSHGMELFSSHCAGCHQIVGEGGVVTGAKVPPLDHATPRQVREAVRIGPYVMPPFPASAISDRELDDIVAYVRYVQEPRDAGGWGINHLGPFSEGLVAWLLAMTVLVATCVAIGSRVKRT